MNINEYQTSVAVFGSAARGDHDRFSDNDLLIVSDDFATLKFMQAKYSLKGWSCTAYSWPRLQRAADRGSLFVQHLKQESSIIRDPTDRLRNLFTRFSTNSSYNHELDGAANLLGDLIETLPNCNSGPMWTLDVLSVSFRSLAIPILANEGIYSFANSDIIHGLIRIGVLSKSDASSLWKLRQYKSLYRRGVIENQVDWAGAHDLVQIIDHTFRLGLSIRRIHTRDVLDYALACENSLRWSTEWYVRCRRFESALWMLKPLHNIHFSEFKQKRHDLFKIVKAPSSYGWRFSHEYDDLQRNLLELANVSAI